MNITEYPDVNALLGLVLAGMRKALGDRLVGLYLYGSLVTGDFNPAVSDVDMLAAIATPIDDATFVALDQMHSATLAAMPHWVEHFEIVYVTLDQLQTFRTNTSLLGLISPGESFHLIPCSKHWLMNWYIVRQQGRVLWGPPPAEIIAPISKEEFIETARAHMTNWREWIEDLHRLGSQAYAILTVCRGMYTLRFGEQTSKIRAAAWAQQEYPQWADLIAKAVRWRTDWQTLDIDAEATFPETRRFVYFAIDQIQR